MNDFKVIKLLANGGLRCVEWLYSAGLQVALTHNCVSLSFRSLAQLMVEIPGLGWTVLGVEDY